MATLVTDLATTLGDELLGVYLHGSLAMGCFNPQRSDVDILVATRGRLPALARPRLARLLLKLSGGPAPIELSVVNAAGLHPWRHPAPYEFHYSEDWRDRTQAHLLNNTWPEAESEPTDPDLAAHVAVTLARGLSLWGPPAAEVFPAVPASDYIASILADFHWGRDTLGRQPGLFCAQRVPGQGLSGRGNIPLERRGRGVGAAVIAGGASAHHPPGLAGIPRRTGQ